MNYDLITKLAKLANNNPNENEANLAARKVCKLLAEGKFEFTIWPIKTTQPQSQEPYSKPEPQYKTAEQQYREQQQQKPPFNRPPRWNPGFNPFSSWFDTDFGNSYKETQHRSNYKYQKQKSEKRSINCSKCGKTELTAFVGDTSTYLCYKCYFDLHAGH